METLNQDSLEKERNVVYAKFGERLLAYIVDIAILFIPMGMSIYYGYGEKNFNFLLGGSIITALYKPVMEGIYGATLGKMAAGIRMVDSDQNQIDFGTAFLKNGFHLINSAIGILTIVWLFTQSDFMEAENIMESIMVNENSPYQTIASIWYWVVVVSCFTMINSSKGQTLHDRIAKTFCIKDE